VEWGPHTNQTFCDAFLGMFAQSQKAPVSFIMLVHLSIHIYHHGSHWMDFLISESDVWLSNTQRRHCCIFIAAMAASKCTTVLLSTYIAYLFYVTHTVHILVIITSTNNSSWMYFIQLVDVIIIAYLAPFPHIWLGLSMISSLMFTLHWKHKTFSVNVNDMLEPGWWLGYGVDDPGFTSW
jgi:hypothetical protein